jgi:hypothetical protein
MCVTLTFCVFIFSLLLFPVIIIAVLIHVVTTST